MKTAPLCWAPDPAINADEKKILDRLAKRNKLFVFLRQNRLTLFDQAFQEELAQMYRDTGEGKQPVPPALICMVLLLQAYSRTSDADAIDKMVDDRQWQVVLGMLGATEPAFAQGTLHNFRQRLIKHDLDLRLLERTVEIAKETRGFDWKKLPKTMRLAIDSRPIEGAGRVEDSINLIGHAAFKLLRAAAALLGRGAKEIAACAGAPIFLAPSIKAGLDIDWTNPEEKAEALGELLLQIDSLEKWIRDQVGEKADTPPLKDLIDVVASLRNQDVDPEPPDGGPPQIRDGVAKDRRVSVEDPDMRHGRKSKSKRFNGYKQHIVNDLDTELILACAITPANRPEGEGIIALEEDLRHLTDEDIGQLFVDRAYSDTQFVKKTETKGAEVFCKPRNMHLGERFSKADFKLDFRLRTITCPTGQTQKFKPGQTVEFNATQCNACPMRARCTKAANDVGRTVHIAIDEQRQHRFRKLVKTSEGRAALRKRVGVEHRLAHLAMKQGNRARYRGRRMNLFDLRRCATLLNLEVINRRNKVATAA